MLFSPCLVLGLAALPMCAPNPLISCGQEFLSKGNVGKVEGGKVTSEKSSYIFSFHISCSKEFLYKGNIWGFSSHFLCTGIPYHRKYGRRWCYYFFQKSPFLPLLFSHFLWTGIPDRRKCEDQETTVRHLNNCPNACFHAPSIFIKNHIDNSYKKLQPQISGFIKKLNFWK